jgi:hypothetical protein
VKCSGRQNQEIIIQNEQSQNSNFPNWYSIVLPEAALDTTMRWQQWGLSELFLNEYDKLKDCIDVFGKLLMRKTMINNRNAKVIVGDVVL